MTDKTLLSYYCDVTGHHPVCENWHKHRGLVNLHLSMLQAQLDSIPDAMAIGKTVQQARETGQQSITGQTWTFSPSTRVTVEYLPDDIHEVHWKKHDPAVTNLGYTHFSTDDPLIRKDGLYQFIEDVRAATAVAYKGICRAHVFVDGQPDVWNEWK